MTMSTSDLAAVSILSPREIDLARTPGHRLWAIAALCPICGGWTMMHGEPLGETAVEWSRWCYVIGELVVLLRPESLGISCPQSEFPISERTCASESLQVPE